MTRPFPEFLSPQLCHARLKQSTVHYNFKNFLGCRRGGDGEPEIDGDRENSTGFLLFNSLSNIFDISANQITGCFPCRCPKSLCDQFLYVVIPS